LGHGQKEKVMSALQAMAIAIAVSVCVSTVLVAGLLSPLLIALVFGVPYSQDLVQLDAGQLAQRVLSSALFGAFAALAGIGLRMSTLRMPPRA
jgi:hypothetical protein